MVIDQSADAWCRLLGATEILHSNCESPFHERLFRATRLVFGDTCHGFESFAHDGSHSKESDIPWPEARIDDFVRRSGEVVPLEHPVFPLLMAGETRPMRLSDLTSSRQLRRTNLYNDLWKPVDVQYQIVIPLASSHSTAALAILRGGKDFSDAELGAAQLFARHVRVAWETARIVQAALDSPARPALDADLVRTRGLSKRETEVLRWVAEGKRNAEIAIILAISPRTVEVHLTSVFRKLGVESRAGAMAMMRRPSSDVRASSDR
ncbi:MAG: helix-turn-helix transcriptional regulator [Labilithrix sp.]|nr:helix-turn-helix transcriptional regulator [Labilithrix sp.]